MIVYVAHHNEWDGEHTHVTYIGIDSDIDRLKQRCEEKYPRLAENYEWQKEIGGWMLDSWDEDIYIQEEYLHIPLDMRLPELYSPHVPQ